LIEPTQPHEWQEGEMNGWMQDVRYALRQLRRSPGFALTAVLTLSLGIGATTAMYHVVSEVLLQPLPYPDQGSLVGVAFTFPQEQPNAEQTGVTADFLLAHNKSFASMGVADDGALGANFSVGNGKPRSIRSLRVSSGYLPTLGVAPMLGRLFTREDDQPGGAPLAVLSYGLWKTVLNSDAHAVGRTVEVNGDVYTVIGVMPESFVTAESPDLWQPLRLGPAVAGYEGTNFQMVARLKPGASLEQARAELKTLSSTIYVQYPYFRHWYPGHPLLEERAWLLRDVVVSGVKTSLLSLMAAMVMVLLLACLNLAVLMTARALGRQREMALRMALGATRWSIVRLLMIESLMLAIAGSVAGVGFAWIFRMLMRTVSPVSLPSLNPGAGNGNDVWWMLGVALLVGCSTTLVFGLLPAMRLLTSDVTGALGTGQASGVTVSSHKTGRLLMIGQVALATMLLSAGALLLGTFLNMRSIPTGVVAKRLHVMQVNLKGDKYANALTTAQFVDRVEDGLRKIPGVARVAAVNGLPLDSGYNNDGWPVKGGKELSRNVDIRFVTPGFFHTVGTALLMGRDVTTGDHAGGAPVALVNEAMAQLWWHGQSPIGEYVIRVDGQPREIVGVVADSHDRALASPMRPTMYEPFAQVDDPTMKAINGWFPTSFVIRVAGDMPIATEAARALHDADPEVPVGKFTEMQNFVDKEVAASRFFSWIAGGFSGFALLLTMIGLFGLLSYQVGMRTREIGVRMAVGADRGLILLLVLRRGIALTLIGLAIGAVGSLALRRVVISVLTGTIHTRGGNLGGVLASGALTVGCAAAALLIAALLASYLPARRAASIEPTQALRAE
jgi:predicted permease